MLPVLCSALALGFQAVDKFPTKPFDLPALQDENLQQTRIDFKSHKATVVLFVAVDCPIANRYAPEIKRIAADYGSKGVAFYRIYLLGPKDADEVQDHTKEYGFDFPALLDPDHLWVKAMGAKVTPEAMVFGPDSKMLYRGRIDDQNIEHGRIRPGYRHDLRVTLDEILAGKKVSVRETAAVGCFIPG